MAKTVGFFCILGIIGYLYSQYAHQIKQIGCIYIDRNK